MDFCVALNFADCSEIAGNDETDLHISKEIANVALKSCYCFDVAYAPIADSLIFAAV